jgi:hypothetical protein
MHTTATEFQDETQLNQRKAAKGGADSKIIKKHLVIARAPIEELSEVAE